MDGVRIPKAYKIDDQVFDNTAPGAGWLPNQLKGVLEPRTSGVPVYAVYEDDSIEDVTDDIGE